MIFARHAQSEWNELFSKTRIDPGIPDARLTAVGIKQAENLAEKLVDYDINMVVASPYMRTLQTAEIAASALGVPILVNELVRERCVFSCDIGSNPSVLREAFAHIDFDGLIDGWWGEPPESEAAIAHRCALFRQQHGDLLARDDVAVISHWGFIRAFTGQEVDNATIVHASP
ncbi:MAG: histidine phosphatase family protein [Pseudomonadota bacterium]